MTSPSRLPIGVGPGSIVGDRYRLLRQIGEGNMGVVFEAEAPGGVRVALKLLCLPEGAAPDGEARARFVRESSVSLQLRAAHVVAVHDHGVDGRSGLPFMVMDLLVGEDLESLIGRVGALEPATAVKIFLQASEGLAAAHEMGVVHRDVKPSNIFLCTLPGGQIDVRICDFGAAKVFGGQQLTQAGALVGTPLFIAPEQLRSARDADARSDVWSLGMSLYFALAGVPALDQVKSFGQLVNVLVTGDIPLLQKAAPWIAPQLARIVHGALLVKVDARCPSARDFRAALARCNVGGDEVTAAALVGVHPDTKSHPREVAPLASQWSEVLTSMPSEPPPTMDSPALAPPPAYVPAPVAASPRRGTWPIVAVGLALVLAAIVGVVLGRSGASPGAAPAAPATTVTAPR